MFKLSFKKWLIKKSKIFNSIFFKFNLYVQKIFIYYYFFKQYFSENQVSARYYFMFKKFFFFICFCILTGCATPHTAFLGPIYTGAKTGSVYQASLSYSSGKIVNRFKSDTFFPNNSEISTFKNKNPILPDIPFVDKDPIILVSYKVNKVLISETIEPEPLP